MIKARRHPSHAYALGARCSLIDGPCLEGGISPRSKAAQKSGVKFLAGPLFSFNHKTIAVIDAPKVESVMEVLTDLHIAQWNSLEVQPYLTAEEADKSIDANEPLY